jgi:hypothetical protein
MKVRWKEFFGIGGFVFLGSIVLTFLVDLILGPEYGAIPLIFSGFAFLGWLFQIISNNR